MKSAKEWVEKRTHELRKRRMKVERRWLIDINSEITECELV